MKELILLRGVPGCGKSTLAKLLVGDKDYCHKEADMYFIDGKGNYNFDPSKIKVLEKSNVSGREIINVSLEDGSNVLFYKSSGANVATTGKQAGEWFVIPGFAENGWFFKTQETINLTKGGNKYLTDMAEFLNQNGSNKLGVH